MLKVFYPQLFDGTEDEKAANELSAKCYEFSDFWHRAQGDGALGGATFHDGCHGLRELGNKKQARALLAKVQGLELVEMRDAETCCGFGGTFASKFPMISTAMEK